MLKTLNMEARVGNRNGNVYGSETRRTMAVRHWPAPGPRGSVIRSAILALCLLEAGRIQAADQRERASPPPEWRQATLGYEYAFPRDHGPHEDYRIEWWYYTGNLRAVDGRAFGYQLTFFRTGVSRDLESPSRWAVRHLYLAHFAISDIERRSFRFFERINRRGIGWAGAAGEPHRVWNEDWELTLRDGRHHLKAKEDGHGIDLVLTSRKPIVIHGEGGISRKGEQAGNASHYYSLTRLLTTGSLTIDGERLNVTGTSWMDHEFGTSFLEEGDLGWDWFSLQLDDGRELMLYRIRRAGDVVSPYSSGTLIDRDGRTRHLRLDDFQLTPGARWRSAATGASYPIDWTVAIPDLRLRLRVEAAFPGQELRTTESAGVSYWEGAVRATGSEGETRVEGLGYLEMTGYAGKGMREIFEE